MRPKNDRSRQRESGPKKDRTAQFLACTITVGFFGLLILMLFVNVPSDSETVLNIMIGVLGSQVTAVYSYFFGSSRGSEFKTQMIADQKDAMVTQQHVNDQNGKR